MDNVDALTPKGLIYKLTFLNNIEDPDKVLPELIVT